MIGEPSLIPHVAQLNLISIVCNETEDYTGSDEIYITVKGKNVWHKSMDTSEPKKARKINQTIQFDNKVRIDLWDEDTGFFDDDDHLGRTYAYAAEAGKGELEYVFKGCGSNYRLTYLVLA
jgi:hypothetical protein